MIVQALLLLATLSAPGTIYRCATANGSVHYQELPCADSGRKTLSSNKRDSKKNLHQWLGELRKTLPSQRGSSRGGRNNAAAPSRSYTGSTGLPARPIGEAALATCSAMFLECAHSSGEKMDHCVSQISRCSSRQGGACCDTAFIKRYQLLRTDGAARQAAVRDALLRD